MICSSCGAENRPDRKFCLRCGTGLAIACSNCGAPNEPDAGFCGECGRASTSATATDAATPEGLGRAAASSAPSGQGAISERRLVSVLFADLVGFTAIAEGRDPEETRELLSRYFELAREVIERYGGIVEKFIGDAVMAVWGAPTAFEDDAERSVRAGLELVDAVHGLGPGIEARAGVLTGEAAVTHRCDGRRDGRRRPREHREPPPVASRRPVRSSSARPRSEPQSTAIVFEPVGEQTPQGQGQRRCPPGGRCGSSRSAAVAIARARSRRRSSGATKSCACSRTCSTRPAGRGEPGSCRSSGRPASARVGSRGSSSSTSTVSSRPSGGTTADRRPTARASPSGRSAR